MTGAETFLLTMGKVLSVVGPIIAGAKKRDNYEAEAETQRVLGKRDADKRAEQMEYRRGMALVNAVKSGATTGVGGSMFDVMANNYAREAADAAWSSWEYEQAAKANERKAEAAMTEGVMSAGTSLLKSGFMSDGSQSLMTESSVAEATSSPGLDMKPYDYSGYV